MNVPRYYKDELLNEDERQFIEDDMFKLWNEGYDLDDILVFAAQDLETYRKDLQFMGELNVA